MKKLLFLLTEVLFILCLTGCSLSTDAYPEENKSDIVINFEDDGDINGYRLPTESYDSERSAVSSAQPRSTTDETSAAYCANTKTKKFHKSTCASAKRTNEENKYFTNDRNSLIAEGYEPCKKCNP